MTEIDNTGPEPLISRERFEELGITLRRADHPHSDPGDGRSECPTCGKWVWPVIHSCKGVRVTTQPKDSGSPEPTAQSQSGIAGGAQDHTNVSQA